MKKEIRVVDEARGIRQVTLCDERWYTQDIEDPATGVKRTDIRPSVSWIASAWPKGPQYEHWLKSKGYTSDSIVAFKGDEGHMVHRGVYALNCGHAVKPFSDEFVDQDGKSRTLTYDECEGIRSYQQWWEEEGSKQFRIIGFETVAWPDPLCLAAEHRRSAKYFNFGGMKDIDLEDLKTGHPWVVDCKISPHVYMSTRLQLEMYRLATPGAKHTAVLQLNYKANRKKKYKFTETRLPLSKLCANWDIWDEETRGIVPLQREYPLEIKL